MLFFSFSYGVSFGFFLLIYLFLFSFLIFIFIFLSISLHPPILMSISFILGRGTEKIVALIYFSKSEFKTTMHKNTLWRSRSRWELFSGPSCIFLPTYRSMYLPIFLILFFYDGHYLDQYVNEVTTDTYKLLHKLEPKFKLSKNF